MNLAGKFVWAFIGGQIDTMLRAVLQLLVLKLNNYITIKCRFIKRCLRNLHGQVQAIVA